jgi:DNA-binding MarR family transcriptional regulator
MNRDVETDHAPIEVWRSFLETWKLWKKGVEKNLQKIDLGSTEYSILRHLTEEGQMPMVQMANLIMVTQGWITGLIDTMEEKHLVKRIRSPTDRRVIEIMITTEGKELYSRAKIIHINYIERCLGYMDNEKLENTMNTLRELKNGIETIDVREKENSKKQ